MMYLRIRRGSEVKVHGSGRSEIEHGSFAELILGKIGIFLDIIELCVHKKLRELSDLFHELNSLAKIFPSNYGFLRM